MSLDHNELPHIIVGALMEVHKLLGVGLEPEAYRECVAHEFRMRELVFSQNRRLDLCFKNRWIDGVATLDFVIEDSILLEVHSSLSLTDQDKARMRNLLRISGFEVGFLVNFNVPILRDGIRRLIVSEKAPPLHYR
jgi:GxxExxY protein